MVANSVTVFPDENIELKVWAAQLRIDFNTENYIPVLDREENWREWGNVIATSQTFLRAGVPVTDNYENWREWAQDVYSIL